MLDNLNDIYLKYRNASSSIFFCYKIKTNEYYMRCAFHYDMTIIPKEIYDILYNYSFRKSYGHHTRINYITADRLKKLIAVERNKKFSYVR